MAQALTRETASRPTRAMTRAWREKNEIVARDGMVVAKHPLAAQAGLAVLERGGNAVDAAVTTALAATAPYTQGNASVGWLA